MNASNKSALQRVLDEIKAAGNSSTTAHSSYVSGVFEDPEPAADDADKLVLNRVLAEVRATDASRASTTTHSSYVSGIFEDSEDSKD